MFLQPFQTSFLNLQSHREALTQMLDNTAISNKPADIDSGLVNGQRFDSRLPCADSKPVLNLSKAGFLKLFLPGRGRRRDQRIARLRAEVPRVSHPEEGARNLCLAGYSPA